MKLGWMTDLHLNFLDGYECHLFMKKLSTSDVDGWLVSGDIGESSDIVNLLGSLGSAARAPVYFVLGNHDYYGRSFEETTKAVQSFIQNRPNLIWLTWDKEQEMGNCLGHSKSLAIVGDDGWGDGRLGRPFDTPVMLNDFVRIKDLRGLDRVDLVEKVRQLGDESVARLEPKLLVAAQQNDEVVVVTHVPPFGGATWHLGQLSTPDWTPWFTSLAMGDLLLRVAKDFPKVNFHVLCGHTHGSGEYDPCNNIHVLTGGAEYGAPKIERILEF